MDKKKVIIFLAGCFLVPCMEICAQKGLDKTSLRYYLSEDHTSYVGASFANQVWARYIWNNPNETGPNPPGNFDVAIRRSRLSFYANLLDKVFVYTTFGADGISYQANGNPGVSLYNAQAEYFVIKDKFHLGGGLNTWNGISRYANCKFLETLTLDNPGFVYPFSGRQDRFGRQLGVYAKGTLGHFHYRVSVVKPFRYGEPDGSEIMTTTERQNDNLAYKGYFVWHFFDRESTQMPYMTMNNLGRARLLNLGAGFYYHPDAMMEPLADGTRSHDIRLFAADLFLDLPLGRGSAVTAYLAYNNYDFGEGYVRSAGTMNVFNGTATDMAIPQGAGNAEWEIGTGHIVRGEFGYLFKGKGLRNRLQPYGAFTWKNLEALDDASFQYDLGLNWFVYGSNIKLTLQYSSRPIYERRGDRLEWTTSRGQLILQTQLCF